MANVTKPQRPGDQVLPHEGSIDVGPEVISDIRRYEGFRNAAILNSVVSDFEARIQLGIERYGHPLQTNNGRDSLLDAYQELLDSAHYLKQANIESKNGKVQLTYWSVLGLIFDLKTMMDTTVKD